MGFCTARCIAGLWRRLGHVENSANVHGRGPATQAAISNGKTTVQNLPAVPLQALLSTPILGIFENDELVLRLLQLESASVHASAVLRLLQLESVSVHATADALLNQYCNSTKAATAPPSVPGRAK